MGFHGGIENTRLSSRQHNGVALACLEHLQQLFQIDYIVMFSNFVIIWCSSSSFKIKTFSTICSSKLSYIIIFSLFLSLPLSVALFFLCPNKCKLQQTQHLPCASPSSTCWKPHQLQSWWTPTRTLASSPWRPWRSLHFVGRAFFMIWLTFAIGKNQSCSCSDISCAYKFSIPPPSDSLSESTIKERLWGFWFAGIREDVWKFKMEDQRWGLEKRKKMGGWEVICGW